MVVIHRICLLGAFILLYIICQPLAAEALGNFSLPPSQRPGPVVAFGQQIVPKGVKQIQTSFESINDNLAYANIALPSVIVGLSDRLTVATVLPYFLSLREEGKSSAGLSDPILQVEYAFYSNEIDNFSEEATLFGSLSLPRGSKLKDPATSLDVKSYFIGGTYQRLYPYWYGFASLGLLHFDSKPNLALGNEFFYQAGIGKNLHKQAGTIVLALLEINGRYISEANGQSELEAFSGGNIINLTPSLAYTNRLLNVQLGYTFPIFQRWNDNQFKRIGLTTLIVSWTFYD